MNENNKKYQIIYADPPWYYQDKSKSHGGGAESHYPCMKTADIMSLPIKDIVGNNAILLLWSTLPQLEEALKVIKAWGFIYKTGAFTWVKLNKNHSYFMGMGRYTRSNPELCLLAVRGKGVCRINKSIPNLQVQQRGKHSQKPDIIRSEIERLFGNLPRIELFARQKVEGWDCWGNEVESDIEL